MYELEQRELRSRFHIAAKLLELGYQVHVFQHKSLALIAAFARPGAIFLKSTSYENDEIIKTMSARGFKIFLWSEEGLHHTISQPESLTFSKNSSRYIDKYAAWHSDDATLAQKFGVKQEVIEVVGNVRMELASSISRSKKKVQDRNRVLLVTNFDLGIFSYGSNKTSNFSREFLDLIENTLQIQKSEGKINSVLYSSLVELLVDKGFQVKVRPHYHDLKTKSQYSEHAIDNNMSIFDTLAEVDFVITYGSTVSIEAALAGVPSLILNSNVSNIDFRIQKIGKVFNSTADVVAELDSLRESEKLSEAYVNRMIDEIGRQFGAAVLDSKHVDWIVASVEQTEFLKIQFCFFSRIRILSKFIVGICKKWVKSLLLNQKHIPKARRFKKLEVLKELEKISAVKVIEKIQIRFHGTLLVLTPSFKKNSSN